MGFGGISPWSLILILAIVLLLFGTKRLKNIGNDLGGAIRGFKKSMSDGEKSEEQKQVNAEDERVIDGELSKDKEKDKDKV